MPQRPPVSLSLLRAEVLEVLEPTTPAQHHSRDVASSLKRTQGHCVCSSPCSLPHGKGISQRGMQ